MRRLLKGGAMPSSRLDVIFGAALQSLRQDARADAELLARFLDNQDEAAFEALVVRHTPAVRAACRGWLRSAADVDDAAQATFLVLVQRGHAIRNRPALGRWLAGVAVNVARRLRRQQKAGCAVPDNIPDREPSVADDLGELLHEEIARLPEKYRLPVQMCYAAGLTAAQAALRLGWPRGTVLTRLAWARQRLQKRLTCRGVTPAVLGTLLAGMAAPAVSATWVTQTVRAAMKMRAGEPAGNLGVSGRTLSLSQGVVRAMYYDRVKVIVLAALLAVGIGGFGIGHWASASNNPGQEHKARAGDPDPRGPAQRLEAREPEAEEPAAAPQGKEGRPGTPGRRREAVIRLPLGTFVKEVDVAPYGSGRLTWTYEEDRVLGLIEGSVMGFELELAIEAEYSLSSSGTIYGLITSVRLNHVRLPDGEEFAELQPFVGLWPAVEPLVNDTLIDLPFSYQFRLQGDRLIISNFRMLLSGPNPLGKVGGILAAGESGGEILACFQALGTAFEGSYTSGAREKPPAGKRPVIRHPRRATGMPPLHLPNLRRKGNMNSTSAKGTDPVLTGPANPASSPTPTAATPSCTGGPPAPGSPK
jgi:RNA polymerase sigma factor (sigma-70 family)